MELDPVQINDQTYAVECIITKNKHANARLKGDKILISIPSRWPSSEKQKTIIELKQRAVKAISSGKWKYENRKKIRFFHGQQLVGMGKTFNILFHPSKRFNLQQNNGTIDILVPMHLSMDDKTSSNIRTKITNALLPILSDRINYFNENHFNANITNIRVKDTITLWGSLAPDQSLSLNFRLLFMPSEILDYVIVHELAHTKYKSHGKRFWQIVENIIPDHKQRRKWLREHGWSFPRSNTQP